MVHDILLDAIENSNFGKFAKSRGFRKVFDKEYDNDGRHTQYIIGFESQGCRMAVFYEFGGSIALVMGRLADEFDGENSWSNWVNANDLINYLDRKPIEFRFPKRNLLKDNFLDYLNETIVELEPRAGEVFALFSEDADLSWRGLYKEYRTSEINRRFK